MKYKSHSGAKKRVKVRKSGTAMVQKSCKNHLLVNKSKGQKKTHKSGYPVNVSRLTSIRRLLPSVKLQGGGRVSPSQVVVEAVEKAAKPAVKTVSEDVVESEVA